MKKIIKIKLDSVELDVEIDPGSPIILLGLDVFKNKFKDKKL